MGFELVLFSTEVGMVQEAERGGVGTFIVDWECRGKESRQMGFDTQVNREDSTDLKRLRGITQKKVLCRINGFGGHTAKEVSEAIGGGADEILLPMVRTTEEVERTLDLVDDKCGLGILIETPEAVQLAPKLASLPLSRVYVGLNDLAISRGSGNIFEAISDGTVEKVRKPFSFPFGFAGLTLPDKGSPLPCRLLISEMARLQSNFSFLRRSFHRDVEGRDIAAEVARLRGALQVAFSSHDSELELDHQDLVAQIRAMPSDWGRPE